MSELTLVFSSLYFPCKMLRVFKSSQVRVDCIALNEAIPAARARLLSGHAAATGCRPCTPLCRLRYLNKQNIAPSIENYEILYRGNLPEGKRSVPQAELLEQLYQKFNCARPMDYHGHSLSVSDVIMLNQDGKISAHYVDSIGFSEGWT